MQAALPCFLMGNGPGSMMLRGGTNAEMAPPIDYTVMVCILFDSASKLLNNSAYSLLCFHLKIVLLLS
jgi:hypothetical protein